MTKTTNDKRNEQIARYSTLSTDMLNDITKTILETEKTGSLSDNTLDFVIMLKEIIRSRS